MAHLPGIDPATFTVPTDKILIFKSGDSFFGKDSAGKSDYPVDTDDMLRMDLTAADLPSLLPMSVYTTAHAAPAMENLDKSSAFVKTAAYKYATMVKDQKASRAELNSEIYKATQQGSGDVKAERERAMAAEATLQSNIETLDASVTFKKIIDRINVYPGSVTSVGLMVIPGVYYCATDAAKTGGVAHTGLPEGTAEGLLLVTKNSQVFIEGGTAKGRMFYRYETGAYEPTQYTEAWTSGAMLKDVTDLETSIKAIIGTVPTGMTVMETITDVATDLATLRTAVTATSGVDAIVVTDGTDSATKSISLKLKGTTMSQSTDGLKCELTMKKQATAETGFAATYFLTDSTGTNVIGDKINLIKDQFLKSASIYVATGDTPPEDWGSSDPYIKGHKYIRFVFATVDPSTGAESETVFYLDVESIIDTYTGKDAIIVDQVKNEISLKVKDTFVKTGDKENTKLLYQDTDGLKVQGVQEGITYAVTNEKTRAEGAETTLQSNIDAEASARATAVAGEASAREGADNAIRGDMNAGLATKVTSRIATASNGTAIIFNEASGGGAKIERADGSNVFVGVNDSNGSRTDNNALGSIYALNASGVGTRFTLFSDMITYITNAGKADRNDSDYELAVKLDVANAKAEAIQTAEDKDAARYVTVTSDIAAAKTELKGLISAEEASRIAADNTKVTIEMATANGGKSFIFNEADGGGAKIEQADGRWIFSGVNNGTGASAEENVASIYSLKKVDGVWTGLRFVVMNDKITYVPNGTLADCNDTEREIAVIGDVNAEKADRISAVSAEEAARIAADNTKVTISLDTANGGKSKIFNEVDGGGAKIERADGAAYFVGVNDSNGSIADNNAVASIYALNASGVGTRFTVFNGMITYCKNAAKAARNDSKYELAVKEDITTEASARSFGDAALQSNLDVHAALNSRHTAVVEFVKTTTSKTLEFKRYICKAALTGTLPVGDAVVTGTEIIVSVIDGGEGTIINAGTNTKIDDGSASGASQVALNLGNATYHFFYDADAKMWYIL